MQTTIPHSAPAPVMNPRRKPESLDTSDSGLDFRRFGVHDCKGELFCFGLASMALCCRACVILPSRARAWDGGASRSGPHRSPPEQHTCCQCAEAGWKSAAALCITRGEMIECSTAYGFPARRRTAKQPPSRASLEQANSVVAASQFSLSKILGEADSPLDSRIWNVAVRGVYPVLTDRTPLSFFSFFSRAAASLCSIALLFLREAADDLPSLAEASRELPVHKAGIVQPKLLVFLRLHSTHNSVLVPWDVGVGVVASTSTRTR